MRLDFVKIFVDSTSLLFRVLMKEIERLRLKMATICGGISELEALHCNES